ncbi:MAG TPA: PASTA domain-containing protein, partial [Acidimicrobiales bacterium]
TVSQGPAPVKVPNVEGMTAREANEALTEAGFIVNQVPVEDDSVEEGRVVSQDPKGDTEAAKGATVTINVSTGAGTVAVPSVAGLSEGDARAALEGAGLAVGSVTQEASGDVPAGSVIRSDPAQGAQVPKGQSVNLIVSSGPDKVSVPGVEGLSEDNATSQLENAGLSVETSDEQVSNPGQDGKVLSQSPQAGTQANPGDTVHLVIGRFREPEITLGNG